LFFLKRQQVEKVHSQGPVFCGNAVIPFFSPSIVPNGGLVPHKHIFISPR